MRTPPPGRQSMWESHWRTWSAQVPSDRTDVSSRPKTVLFTDVEGSTVFNSERGDEVAVALMRVHERAVHEAAAQHDGWVVKSTGDGFLVVFPSCVAGVSCALDIHARLTITTLAIHRPARGCGWGCTRAAGRARRRRLRSDRHHRVAGRVESDQRPAPGLRRGAGRGAGRRLDVRRPRPVLAQGAGRAVATVRGHPRGEPVSPPVLETGVAVRRPRTSNGPRCAVTSSGPAAVTGAW